MNRSVLAALTSAVLVVPMTVGTAQAAPSPQPPSPGIPVVAADGLVRPGDASAKVAPSLLAATGSVTAFVQLDAASGVETAEAGGTSAQ
ncbi:MAG: hypothetical protein HGA44_20465, partial [Cellulomonadaceae bacterium]|nr:hypothetical protein [Cellulomonadaceae bacterium]